MRSKFLPTLFFVIVSVFSARAQDISLNPAKVKELLFRQGIGVRLLTLELLAKKEDLPQALARYDTELKIAGDHTVDKLKRTSAFFGNRTDTSHWNLGLEKKIPTGTTMGFQFLNERERVYNPSAASGVPTAPTYEPILEWKLKQSLGENWAGGLDRSEVKQVRFQIDALDFETRHKANRLTAECLEIFYQWAAAEKAVHISQTSLNAAREFFRLTLEKEKLGTAEKTDRLGAEALVFRREALLADAQSGLEAREAELKSMLNIPLESRLQKETGDLGLQEFSEAQAIEKALNQRLDFQSQKQKLEEKKMALVVAKKKRWPAIDLESTLQLNDVQRHDYYAAAGGMDSPKWKVGVELTFPLENREARGLKKAAEYENSKALYALKQLEQNIIQEAAQKHRALHWAKGAWESLSRASRLEKQKRDAALRGYLRGRFSADQILKYEEDWLEAERQALQASLELSLASVALKEALNQGL